MKTPTKPKAARKGNSRLAGIVLASLVTAGAALQGGDILRGGATMPSKKAGNTQSSSGAAAAARTKAAAQDRLARTSQALQAVRSMQAAARAARTGNGLNLGKDPNRPGFMLPNVPNGLAPGGLDIIGAPTGAQAPAQSGTTVTIKQTAQQALLNWKTFNVGSKTKLVFDQSKGGKQSGQWIAFNRVSDPSGSPSQILGSIKAQGQVYIINQNGIIFGGGSQVNVHALVASSLPINDNLISSGLLNNPDSQFLFSALPIAAGAKGTAAFTPPAPLTPNGRIGDVVVQPGAQLTSPTSADKIGGRIMLVGANVTNAGTISTPDGQTILAAGLQVGIDAHSSKDPTLRGLDVFIGEVGSYAGTAKNTGLIDVPRASTIIAGKTVQQLGSIDSTTSVSFNGRIDLLASYNAVPNPAYDATNEAKGPRFLYKNTGSVTLGAGSVTQILPETWSLEAAVGTELSLRSQINMRALTIHLEQDAMVMAPNATVNMLAGVWKYTASSTQPLSQFVFSNGQIYLDNGSFIDVAGTPDSDVLLAQFIRTVELRGSELANSPLQRDSLLRAVKLVIDLRRTGTYNDQLWVGTPLGDATGFLNLILRRAGQLTAAGGNVTMQAGGSVVLQPGSTIDVSGGWVTYKGGMVETTKVIYQGNLIDIADATPDRIYDGVYTGQTVAANHSSKWGVQPQVFAHALAMNGAHYEGDYISGAAGGSISISAPRMALDGTLTGEVVAGPRQVRSSAVSSSLPANSSLSLSFRGQSPDAPNYYTTYPTGLQVVFQEAAAQAAVAPFDLDVNGLPASVDPSRGGLVYLSPKLVSDEGFGSLTVNNEDGSIVIPAGTTIKTRPGGALSLTAANIEVLGSIISPGGSLSFKVLNISPYDIAVLNNTAGASTPPPNADRGVFTLGTGAVLSTAGLIVDDRPTSITLPDQPMTISGGSVSIVAYSTSLAEGSLIDVSGGVAMSALGRKSYGNGGSISIKAGQDPNLLSVLGGRLGLGAELRGYAGGIGGSLTLQAPLIRIGGGAESENTLVVLPEFFNQGGFGSFTLIGLGAATGEADQFVPAVSIAPGTVIEPYSQSMVAISHADGGRGLQLVPADKPVGYRTPVSISLQAPGVKDSFTSAFIVRGDIVMGENSVIRTEPNASVSFSGNTVAVLGSIYAPAGSISISGAADSKAIFAEQNLPLTTVYIGSKSVLSAAGTTVYSQDPYGRRTGTVLPGGTISIVGNIVAAARAVLDVSGASAVLDLSPAVASALQNYLVPVTSGVTSPLYSLRSVATRVDSNGGVITLKGGQMLYSDATLLGHAGGPTALGGGLIVSSGRFYPEGSTPLPTDPNLVVWQSGSTIPVNLPNSAAAIGKAVFGTDGVAMQGQGYFTVDTFAKGGFDSLALNGIVQFKGRVKIDARGALLVASGGVMYADSLVELTAPYVALGMPFEPPVKPEDQAPPFLNGSTAYNFPPTFGPGRLVVNADLIDVGTLSLQNIGFAALIAENGDIRGSGVFNIAGDLFLRAGQIYPVTASPFTIVAYDRNILVATSLQGSATVTLGSDVLPKGFGVGSPLLGSTVKSINGTEVTLESGANASLTNAWLGYAPGSITIEGSGTRPLPLSAGGTLSLYAGIIKQGGVLRAPLGTINIGWDGTGTAPLDLVTGNSMPFPVSREVTLGRGSVTSVSAIDPITGRESLIPYGLILNGTSWIDPTGKDITAGGVTGKTISIGAQNLNLESGSFIDIRGGGDLYAYRWESGLGGTVDILGSSGSFAVIPGYDSNFAPYAPFGSDANFEGDPGYVNSHLKVGDRVYLSASSGLPAGYYTLLPARYALMPGAVLVTPKSGNPIGTVQLPDGSSIVSGYRFNDLNDSRTVPTIASRFEVAPQSVVRSRATYYDYYANTFLLESANSLETAVPRLPVDAGHLILQASQSIRLEGMVDARGAVGGRGGLVDIASTSDILIAGPGVTGGTGVLVLDAGRLSSFGAESLLIGGVRTITSSGATVDVKTGSITVDNAGTPLTAPDLILVAKDNLTVAEGAEIRAGGSLQGPADTLYIGNEKVAGSGDGLLIRVSVSPRAGVVRTAVSPFVVDPNHVGPSMVIGAGAIIAGTNLTLDSTYATSLDPAANLLASVINLNSGQISLQFDDPGALNPTVGLVLAGNALSDLQAASSLSLRSYSSIDIYGTGSFDMPGRLALHAAEIRGFNNGGGTVAFNASSILLDNNAGSKVIGSSGPLSGALEFNASTIRLGAGQLAVKQYANLNLNAPGGLYVEGSGGLSTQGALTAVTPFIIAQSLATQSITAGGALIIQTGDSSGSKASSGLGASLSLQGASVDITSDIRLPSGILKVRATNGDVVIGGNLDVGGTMQAFYDQIRYTSGGEISLASDTGSVTVTSDATISVAAHEGGGDAGTLSIVTPNGPFTLGGTLLASGGAGGHSGTFNLDTGSLPNLGALNDILNDADFSFARTIRVRTGDVLVDGTVKAQNFALSADLGSITVSGTIDASGRTGGSISLAARGDVVLLAGSFLNAAGETFNSAGKGGQVLLEAGTQRDGVEGTGSVDIQTGSRIDLSVASLVAGGVSTPGSSAYYGQFGGKLHIRAPQLAGSTDLRVEAINGTITGASSILVEGYRVFDLTNSGGQITNTGTINANGGLLTSSNNVQGSVKANGQLFGASIDAMTARLLANNAGLSSVFVLAPGAEVINRNGDLTLGRETVSGSTTSSQFDWDLSSYRFGSKNAPGVLTMRASGNLNFYSTLSDGFTPVSATAGNGLSTMWLAPLMEQNALLPVNMQSWSYRLVAGADVNAADYGQVRSIDSLSATQGILKLGRLNGQNSAATPGTNATTSTVIQNRFQVIRTGSGDIDVRAGRSVQFLNPFAAIYTAGTRVTDPTLGGTFDLPILNQTGGGSLGANQQSYAAAYSMAGGNVNIFAQQNIEHLTNNAAGQIIADSSKELPNNWLMRRGYVDPSTGLFGASRWGDIASTSWWVNFSNFFQSVGALGGGNVTMVAGQDISNVDAVIPTNARVAGKDSSGKAIAPDAANLLELGGGDLVVRAGRDIDAGVYYVERGHGTLSAGRDITTNSTRSPSRSNLGASPVVLDPATWLPTTLFVGKGGFDVSARGDLLLGPVANAFLLPQSVTNSYWYKTYFSTYSADSHVNVSSLGGDVTFRTEATMPGSGAGSATSILLNWIQRQQLLSQSSADATGSYFQPWLRIAETRVDIFNTVASLMPPTLRATSFSGDINLSGDIILSPASKGTADLFAAGAINGLQQNGKVTLLGGDALSWGSSRIIVSDANPASIPGFTTPYAYHAYLGPVDSLSQNRARETAATFRLYIDDFFAESGATEGIVFQTKQALHAAGLLHSGDPDPVRLYARSGNISGLALFAPKFTHVYAGKDLTDIALYIQNLDESDVSVVSSGRDIVAYNANTASRSQANSPGNTVNTDSGPLAGDIQISGPGTLQVLAGRNLDLGTGAGNADGTGVGITSIGNGRNPYLPFEGADLLVMAGIGRSNGLSGSAIDFDAFLDEFLDNADASGILSSLDLPSGTSLDNLSEDERHRIALQAFFLVLRDTGRGALDPSSPTYQDYSRGYAAIESLFGNIGGQGDINTQSRDIRTKSGGDISILAPGGGLKLASTVIGEPQTPPGIITESGGQISIFTDGDVDIGISRIFTLRGGDEVIWSSTGDIAAGSSSKTVQSAPPTRVLIDPQSADVQTDLAGLATGGGIGVLATVEGVPEGSVDLIAPVGTVDAGDAGIRATGNVNIAAATVLNASNISAGGSVAGAPAAAPAAAPAIGGLASAAATAGASTASMDAVSQNVANQADQQAEVPSIITVEVLGYGGSSGPDTEPEPTPEPESGSLGAR